MIIPANSIAIDWINTYPLGVPRKPRIRPGLPFFATALAVGAATALAAALVTALVGAAAALFAALAARFHRCRRLCGLTHERENGTDD